MITIDKIQQEIDDIRSNVIITHKTTKKQKSRIEFLKQIKSYIESNPHEEFVISEIKRIERLIKIRTSTERFYTWKIGKPSQKATFQNFKKEMNIIELEQNLDVLKFVLNE